MHSSVYKGCLQYKNLKSNIVFINPPSTGYNSNSKVPWGASFIPPYRGDKNDFGGSRKKVHEKRVHMLRGSRRVDTRSLFSDNSQDNNNT